MIYQSFLWEKMNVLYVSFTRNNVEQPQQQRQKHWKQTRKENKEKKKKKVHLHHGICYGLSACMCPSCKSVHGSLDSYWKRLNENLTDTHTHIHTTHIYSMDYIINTFCSYSLTLTRSLHSLGRRVRCQWARSFCEVVVSTQLEPFVWDMHEFDEIKVISNLSIILNVIFGLYLLWPTCHNSSKINNIHMRA